MGSFPDNPNDTFGDTEVNTELMQTYGIATRDLVRGAFGLLAQLHH